MSINPAPLFDALWRQYLTVTPSAAKIHQLLGGGDPIINDHIALRTFDFDRVGLDKLARPFLNVGYRPCGEYRFEQKKLFARHFEHPDPTQPKVFISELEVAAFSAELQSVVADLVAQLPQSVIDSDAFACSGRHWQLDLPTYQRLLEESEYAAWLAAWGYRANHFTVSINHLRGYGTIEQVNQVLKDAGFVLNASGGEIKGSPEVLLEQSSTMADHSRVSFSDGEATIPSCFYEFARRYPMADGQLYTGFVAASADKIFESTDAR